MVDNSDKCTICLNTYTLTDTHRPTSLECGHLFGNSCIRKWFNKQKSALCPTCTKMCRLRNLRPIYATQIIACENDGSTQRIIALQEEKNKMEMENLRLMTLVELLQKELKKSSTIKANGTADIVAYRFIKKCPFILKDRNVFVEYERCENVVLMTFCNEQAFGLKKIDGMDMVTVEIVFQLRYKEMAVSAGPGYTRTDTKDVRIKDLKVSPFNDSTAILCYENTVKMINTANNSVLMSVSLQEQVTSLSYDYTDRNVIFAGDLKGWLYRIDLAGDISRVQVGESAIHSIHKINGVLYCGCVSGVYVYDRTIEKYEMLTVTNLTGDDKNVLITVRDKSAMIMHVLVENNLKMAEENESSDDYVFNKHFFNFKETKRLRDRVCDNNMFVINNEKKAVMVYDIVGNVKKVFWCGEIIKAFCIGVDKIYVLTCKGFMIYGI
ncbi:RING-finger-containing E3 ubiquitin ligase [Trachipleistophora hominis]|uniref:RING-finger-containing E3 ubiquitin ligase n=1 Tax=Trachipleistophora hominis TaxID=72359 RepID=L7JXR7_TRAHO|nr:RING-finger-containing E3 ubiquitin ligase [Trachipleistophora hominis]